jgi:hypothetical protein
VKPGTRLSQGSETFSQYKDETVFEETQTDLEAKMNYDDPLFSNSKEYIVESEITQQ